MVASWVIEGDQKYLVVKLLLLENYVAQKKFFFLFKDTLNINVYADEDTDLESDYYDDDDYQSLQSLVHQKIVKVWIEFSIYMYVIVL